MKYFIFAFVIIINFSNCTKEVIKEVEKTEAFFDEQLIKNGWRLDAYLNSQGDTILPKPHDLPQDIYLVFTKDRRVVGHIASWELNEGEYTIDDTKNITLSFSIPFLMTCCEWDDMFLDEFRNINNYEIIGNSLKLYYGSNNDKMVFRSN